MADMVAGGMSDKSPLPNMRDRIAAAACGATSAGKLFPWETLSEPQRDAWRKVADAVIAELGLEKQAHYDPFVSAHRWVTDWEADDE